MKETALINRAAGVRLYPNREQAAALRRWQGGLRFVWNNTWAWCKEQRETAGKWLNKAAIQSRMVAPTRCRRPTGSAGRSTRWSGRAGAHCPRPSPPLTAASP